MTEFTSILTHGRKLQGAIKELSSAELKDVVSKLNNIIKKREEKEAALLLEQKEKQDTLNNIRQQLEDAGLSVSDLAGQSAPKSKRAGQKRPVKYILKDSDGEQHPWTGIGRMPRVYSEALSAGKTLESFKI